MSKIEESYKYQISVIIPVYNVEKYLDDCLNSVINQSYSNLEIILVDDGSTDMSPNICENFAGKDNRVMVIHKKNEGLGLARNLGLKYATGKYISFVDSDDTIEINMFEKMVSKCIEYDADVCYCGFKYIKKNGVEFDTPPQKLIYKDKEIINLFIPQILGPLPEMCQGSFAGSSVCTGIYKKSIINSYNLNFVSERTGCISEDTYFNLKFCRKADTVVILPEPLYFYYKREENSLTNNYRADRFEKVKDLYYQLQKEAVELGIIQNSQIRIQTTFLNALIGVLKTTVSAQITNNISFLECYQIIKTVCNDHIVEKVLNTYSLKQVSIKKKLLWFFAKHKLVCILYFLIRIRLR